MPKANKTTKTINEMQNEAEKVGGKVKKNKQIDKEEEPILG